jgi:hypothetical protein
MEKNVLITRIANEAEIVLPACFIVVPTKPLHDAIPTHRFLRFSPHVALSISSSTSPLMRLHGSMFDSRPAMVFLGSGEFTAASDASPNGPSATAR